MKNKSFIILFIVIVFVLPGHMFAQKVFYSEGPGAMPVPSLPENSNVNYTVLLIGDVKYPASNPAMMNLLDYYLKNTAQPGAVVFLGDVVYPKGLPDDDEPGFDQAKNDLETMLSKLKQYTGQIVFTSGNHDWERGRESGWNRVRNAEKFIEKALNGKNVYLPDDGCPGPVEVELNNQLVLIVLNSQWFFQNFEKPGTEEGCDFEDEAGIFIAIEDALRRHQGKHILFAAHHPLISAGNHGGHFPASRLLFPLLDVHQSLYIPLPGFIYTGYRKYLGHAQDIAHPAYKAFRNELMALFKQYTPVVYAAGHEHNLQYKNEEGIYHLVSGGGGEGLYVAKNRKKADFAAQSQGLSVLRYYDDGSAWVDFIVPDESEGGSVIYRKQLYHLSSFCQPPATSPPNNNPAPDTIIAAINQNYLAGSFRRFLMGNNYRTVWAQPVSFEVFDISKAQGGLTILKRGGGQQTRSVRMANDQGRQYVLRSVNKYVEKALDPELRNTIAQDAVQDGISASNPYAALAVPKLADAAGVFHTSPKLVWIPDDPNLGIYRRDLANHVFLFEERPAGNRSDIAGFGNSEKIVSTLDMVEKLHEEQDHQVDQLSVVRARLFDIWLNDWDRHDDQWRWASFKEGDFRVYRPVPRDRDQVFFVNQGVVMWLASRDFIMPKFQGFDYEIKNIKGLGFNARYFDRTFMSQPNLTQWKQIAHQLKIKLTDSVIHRALLDLPPEIYRLQGADLEAKLKARRDNLPDDAEAYYRFLSKTVDVVGTDDRELFEIERRENGNTMVKVTALSSKKGKRKFVLYEREFVYSETKEIRLYGLKDEDKFLISGSGKKGIKTRLIGGPGKDTIIDHSKVRGWGKKTLVYDQKNKNNHIEKGSETALRLLKAKPVNEYNRKQFKYNKNLPLISGGYNIDDGVYLGAGIQLNRFNFRDSTIQKIKGTFAFETNAFSLGYEGLFSAVSQHFDLEVEAQLSMPRNVDNFFGIGNETVLETTDKSYYRVRYEYADVNAMLLKKLSRNFSLRSGIFYQYFKVNDTAHKYIGDLALNKLDTLAYRDHHFGGLKVAAEFDTRNDKVIPQRGVYWNTVLTGFWGADTEAKDFAKLRSDLRVYLSFRTDPRMVLVLRAGGAANFGEYEFYHANFLGRSSNLRGFRSNRFAGDQMVYQNTEMRFKLLKLKNYLFNGDAGVLAFNDLGRVWVKGENSSRWHNGYGFGIWLAPFDALVLTANYNVSVEEKTFTFTFNFLF